MTDYSAMADLDRAYWVNVGPGGTFESSGNYQTGPAQVDALFAGLAQANPDKVVLHFHGGLVNEERGIDIAKKLTDKYVAAGAHPVTFVWETGLGETLWDNLGEIHSTKLFKRILKFVLKRAAKRLNMDVGRGAGKALTDDEAERLIDGTLQISIDAENAARGSMPIKTEEEADDLCNELRDEMMVEIEAIDGFKAELALAADMEGAGELVPDLRDKTAPPGARGARLAKVAMAVAKVAVAVIKRYIKKTDHGLHATTVEELLRAIYVADIGGFVWGSMQRKARLMWRSNEGRSGDERYAGAYFVEGLVRHLEHINPNLQIDLIGHSAGSIVLGRLLETVAERHPNLRFRNIMLMAPAISHKVFRDTYLSNLRLFSGFRMFTMSDANEREDALVDRVRRLYPSSLLYFISGLLEDSVDEPLLGMQRYLSNLAPYDGPAFDEVRMFLAGDGRAVYSKTSAGAAEGRRSGAVDHGFFDDDELTVESLLAIIRA